MPTIALDKKDLLELSRTTEKDLQKLPLMGVQVERTEEDEMEVELEANRPDMFSVEGIARQLRGFLGKETGFVSYPVSEGDFVVKVERSVMEVRPYIGSAHISGIEMNDRLIKSLMSLQEKLHMTVGRKRKKLAIGIHDSSRIGKKITYKAVKPEDVSFVPLGSEEIMNLEEILKKHEKGRKYASILEGFEMWPVLLDERKRVLSFPPIINGALTALNESTREVFLDVTGTDLQLVESTVALLSSVFAERGGAIESALIEYPDKSIRMPDMSGSEMRVNIEYINGLLGLELSGEDMVRLLERARFSAVADGTHLKVRVPSYRQDILHQADIAEEVGISYGYGRLSPEIPDEVTFGRESPAENLKNAIKEVLIGLGFNEIMTLSLINSEIQFKRMGISEGNAVTLENPITEMHTSLRKWMLPSIMHILSENTHRDLPQQVFEIGTVVDVDGKNRWMLAGAVVDDRASFTGVKSIVERLLSDIGVSFDIFEKNHPSFIAGRCAYVRSSGKEIGFFGEISPNVIVNFGMEHPVTAFELDMKSLMHDAPN